MNISTPLSRRGKQPFSNVQFANPTPYHLRALVLDYLCHNCYTDTARAFARDSSIRHLDADGDEIMSLDKGLVGDDLAELTDEALQLVELRKEIRALILSGRVDDGTALLNEHFPSVLSDTDKRPNADSTTQSQSKSDRVEYIASSTVDPTHLSLNLRIQAFIEASRTIPLMYNSPSDPSVQSSPSSLVPHKPADPSHSLYEHDTPESNDAHQVELLHRAQKLYHAANALRNPSDRATYLRELANISGLLAYKVPEESPMIKYLSQERREAVADQINSAILYRTGRPAVSHLELDTRYTSALWNVMHDLNVKRASLANPPPDVQLPPSVKSKSSHAKTSMGSDKDEPVPGFDLRQFLDSKT